MKPGTIVGYCGYNLISQLINLVTYGVPFYGLSHIEIVGQNDVLYGSTTLTDRECYFQGKKVAGVQAHLAETRFKEYKGKIWVYEPRQEIDAPKLERFLQKHLGAPYDYYGAFKAGGFFYRKLRAMFDKESLTSIFCSELCAAAYKDQGLFDFKNKGWSPNALARKFVKLGLVEQGRRV